MIAIIPCKEHSERLPNKNILQFGDKMLFEHSIDFAIKNNITPVVSTDSEFIINYCKQHSIKYIRESVEDSDMCNCIDQVLAQVDCDYFVLLQPTSPIRQSNILNKLGLPKTSIYTADRIKIIGHIGDKFQKAYRDQDTTNFLYHFDGNLVIVNVKWYKKNHCLFNDDSSYYVEDVPYSLQIDNEEQFKVMQYVNSFMSSGQ